MPIEYWEAFEDRASFDEWHGKRGLSETEVSAAVERLGAQGIDSGFFGRISPRDIQVVGRDYREQFVARGLNSRQRAILELLLRDEAVPDLRQTRIYAPEAVTQMALEVRGRTPFFVGSEYASTQQQRDLLYPVQIEDLHSLSLKSGAFDAVFSCDVLEHVPDVRRCLAEMARVLRAGGVMLSTHPFTWTETSTVKARLDGGRLVHLHPPEFHGNPVDAGGSLVFTVPGWDILDLCREVGFSKAEMVMIASERFGIFGGSPPFINVLRARK